MRQPVTVKNSVTEAWNESLKVTAASALSRLVGIVTSWPFLLHHVPSGRTKLGLVSVGNGFLIWRDTLGPQSGIF